MEIFDLGALLRENSYPGRGIVLGRSADDKNAVIAYFIMGRSENSRNRIFAETEDGIRTEAFDPSKMVDPSLIIYHPVRAFNGATIVTNGDQTDTVRDGLAAGKSYIEALRTRQFEPGHFIHTYKTDGNPLPSFEGEPETVRIEGDLNTFADMVWDNLNEENKVSLYVSFIDLETGKASSIIRNKHC